MRDLPQSRHSLRRRARKSDHGPRGAWSPLESRLLTRLGVFSAIFFLSRLRLLFLANVVLQLVDGSATLMGVRLGMAEGNPLLASLMGAVGTAPALLLAKTCAFGGLAMLYCCRRHPLVEPGLASLAVIYTVFAVVPWTVLLANALLA